ncbi:hypothetical protein ABPG74_013670 [Tetrahymena malaccensis]
MRAALLLAMIALATVNAQNSQNSNPSWVNTDAVQQYGTCTFNLATPMCAQGACNTAYNNFKTCTLCPQNSSSYSVLQACIQACGTTYNNDPTASGDATVTAFTSGWSNCAKVLNGSILILSSFFLAAFAILL